MIKELYQQTEPKSHRPSYANKAVLLSSAKWEQMWKKVVSPAEKETEVLCQQEREFREYLKNGSKKMTSTWENTVQNIRDKKEAERLRRDKAKVEEDQRHYRELKAADEIKRRELIQKAEDLIQKDKVGPRVLESAAKFCEVLKGREMQRQFRLEQEQLQQMRKQSVDTQTLSQANHWLKSHGDRLLEDRQRFDNYKRELKETMIRNQQLQRQRKQELIAEEQQSLEVIEGEMRRQQEQDRAALEASKEMRRKNALEAIRMAEDRRTRLRRESEIEDALLQIYCEGQQNIASFKQAIHVNKHRFRDNSHQLVDAIERQRAALAQEERNQARAAEEKDRLASIKEREQTEQQRQLRAARMQAHLDEIEWQRQREAEEAVLTRREYEERLRNIDVTFGFDRHKVADKTVKTYAQRKLLLGQMVEKEVRERREADTAAELRYAKEHADKENRHFLQYAQDLISDAKVKGRPILPLLKTVQSYKREHYHDFKEADVLPQHLLSRVPIHNKLMEQGLLDAMPARQKALVLPKRNAPKALEALVKDEPREASDKGGGSTPSGDDPKAVV
ncbi:trichohyalin isoform X2 [Anopheles merus]|uniref:Trichohyalin-plectin-homology domain-containing protein n=2 Tax=Anopheles merus TaxID=30066 RepID=A0A182V3G0_ANOME|nr:trichohyalin isoform X2 [Anopheles merus]XP_041761328.1 trichohyalin isoform X2 [Anopheles merus]